MKMRQITDYNIDINISAAARQWLEGHDENINDVYEKISTCVFKYGIHRTRIFVDGIGMLRVNADGDGWILDHGDNRIITVKMTERDIISQQSVELRIRYENETGVVDKLKGRRSLLGLGGKKIKDINDVTGCIQRQLEFFVGSMHEEFTISGIGRFEADNDDISLYYCNLGDKCGIYVRVSWGWVKRSRPLTMETRNSAELLTDITKLNRKIQTQMNYVIKKTNQLRKFEKNYDLADPNLVDAWSDLQLISSAYEDVKCCVRVTTEDKKIKD